MKSWQNKLTNEIRGDIRWSDFITLLPPHSIRCCKRSVQVKWRALLSQRDIYIDRIKPSPIIGALINVMYRETHIGTADMKETMSETDQRTGDDGTRLGLD